MSDVLFPEGGHDFEMKVSIPRGEDGMVGCACPNNECAPGYFRIEPGTGLPGGEEAMYCAYCRTAADHGEFRSQEQKEYAVRVFEEELGQELQRKFGKSIGTGGGMQGGGLGISLTFTPSPRRYVSPPMEDELVRDIVCPRCSLHHAVYGVAVWCPDCGADVFLTHVAEELNSIRKVLSEVENRKRTHGARVAARDRENSLEDIVSVFEGAGKFLLWRWLTRQGQKTTEEATKIMKEVKNRLQSIAGTSDVFQEYCAFDPLSALDQKEGELLKDAFSKRHPITHNLGIVDRQYLARARSGEVAGKELRVSCEEIGETADLAFRVIASLHAQLFPALPPQN